MGELHEAMNNNGFVWMDDVPPKPAAPRRAHGVERLHAEIARLHAFTVDNEPTFADVKDVFTRWAKRQLLDLSASKPGRTSWPLLRRAAGLLVKTVLPP